MSKYFQQINRILKLINKSSQQKSNDIDQEVLDIIRFRTIEFDKNSNKLHFIIENFHRQPKITRYVTSNYVRTPIYGDYSVRTKVIKNFDKVINPLKFVNEQIHDLNISHKLKLQLIHEIGIIPEWRKKELALEKKTWEINKVIDSFRSFDQEKKHYDFKLTNFQEIPSNFWIRLLLSLFTLGLSFMNFTSKKKAKINAEINQNNLLWNNEHKNKIDKNNSETKRIIEIYNQKLSEKLEILENEYQIIEKQEINLLKIDQDGWLDLKESFNVSNDALKNKKGVYIIWNKTNNKYYVGQSKNIGQQIFNYHFNNGQVKNIIFAKDWYDGHEFKYKYFICETKDQLDDLKKRYIEEYDSFEKGYNSTKGNN